MNDLDEIKKALAGEVVLHDATLFFEKGVTGLDKFDHHYSADMVLIARAMGGKQSFPYGQPPDPQDLRDQEVIARFGHHLRTSYSVNNLAPPQYTRVGLISNDTYREVHSKELATCATPQAVANFFLKIAQKEGRSLTPLKLIKLVCIAYGWALVTLDQALFREQIEAWDFGPVVPSLYHEFKIYRKSPIDRQAFEYDFEGNSTVPDVKDLEVKAVLTKVWEMYKQLSPAQLVDLTHKEGTPWSEARQSNQKYLSVESIRRHYQHLLTELA